MEDCAHILYACVQVSVWLFLSVEILDFDFIFIIYTPKCQHHTIPTKTRFYPIFFQVHIQVRKQVVSPDLVL